MLENDKERALNAPHAQELLHNIPKEQGDQLIQCFLGNDLESTNFVQLRNYFLQNSDFLSIAFANRTSSIPFDWPYKKKKVQKPIDKYLFISDTGQQIYQRFKAVKKEIARLIRQEYNGRFLYLDNLASGVGHDVIDLLVENPDLEGKVHIRNIDIDKVAIQLGQERTHNLGLSEHISFHRINIHKYKPVDADIVSLIGFLCPMNTVKSKKVIQYLASNMKEGSVLVYSTALTTMLADPFVDYILKMIGWKMDHKTPEESGRLLEGCPMMLDYQFFDEPHRQHCMTVCRKIRESS
ncbi:MAG: methyltransferase domain-containing protein [Desulfobulbaceae bacterium]|nr:methyltransferase domain-containing protein [Desulfobulbaceae bacterium]